jgi:hypothetical protein
MGTIRWQTVGKIWADEAIHGSGYIDLGLLGRIKVIMRSNGEVARNDKVLTNMICNLDDLPFVPAAWVPAVPVAPEVPPQDRTVEKLTLANIEAAFGKHLSDDEPF